MTRIAIGAALLSMIATASLAHAQENDIQKAADQAGVDPQELQGALNTLNDAGVPTDAQIYLNNSGAVQSSAVETASGRVVPSPSAGCGLPICGPFGQRLYCIERFESGHNGAAVNRSSGARGWLQWLPSTARQWGVVVGNRWSEWNAAARIASLGERFMRSQWVTLQQGLC